MVVHCSVIQLPIYYQYLLVNLIHVGKLQKKCNMLTGETFIAKKVALADWC